MGDVEQNKMEVEDEDSSSSSDEEEDKVKAGIIQLYIIFNGRC